VNSGDLLDQIKRDTRVLSEPFHTHIPSTEFFIERVERYTESYRQLRSQEMGISVTTTTTTKVKIAPKLKVKLLTKFTEYQQLKAKLDATKARMDELKGEIADLREDTGEKSLELDGFKTQVIESTTTKYDEKKFIADGGDIAVYKGALKIVPKKAYEKISLPGVKEEE
jgi:cell division protein FtsB